MRHWFNRRFTALIALAVLAGALSAASAGPAGAQRPGFHDVPSLAYYSTAVLALDAQGVFDGTECAGGGFCPDDPIDRKTMAVWTVRMLDGDDPLAITESRFDDVEGDSFYAPFIERMYHLSVTDGCGDGLDYCPDDSVSRAQMAAFLSRGYELPDGPDPGFRDVAPGAGYAAELASLVASGITRGCRDGTVFCPDDPTTRGQMALFLHRAEARNRWVRSQGITEEGFSYVEFRVNANLTELRWRPKGLALVVRCTDVVDESGDIEPELEVSTFGYGARSWFFGDYGVIEYRFGDQPHFRRIFTFISEDNNVLIMPDDDILQDDVEGDFLEAMEHDTSSQLFLALYDELATGAFDFEIDGEFSVVGYREHVKPLVDACD